MLKKTPLNKSHIKLGARMVDFGGWEMPVQYDSIITEHIATRENAGIFDVSHMGEITIKGKNAKEALNKLVTCDLDLLKQKKIAYTFLPNEKGGVVDDLLVYMINDEEFFLVVNASNTDKDYAWLKKNISGDVKVLNHSDDYGQIALQGPNAQNILQKLTDFDLDNIKFFTFDYVKICGKDVILSRTGYTGEDGFEIYCGVSDTEKIWDSILEAGEKEGIKPAGLGARDTLRAESALPLYGHELDEDITPIEAGLKFFVKLNKTDFLGKSIMEKQVLNGTERKLTGIEFIERGIPRDGYRVEKDGRDIGYITSGFYSPTFKKGLAIAMISSEFIQINAELDVVIRDKRVKGKITELPFYKKNNNK